MQTCTTEYANGRSAVNSFKTPGLSNETKLEFYGLYKQATVGPCNTSKPGLFDLKGKN